MANVFTAGDITQYRKVGKVEILEIRTGPLYEESKTAKYLVKFLTGPKKYRDLGNVEVWLTVQ